MIFRFLRNLTSSRAAKDETPQVEKREEYEGFTIEATPQKDTGGWRIRGVISRATGGEPRSRTFVRADTYADKSTAVDMTMMKARRIIDEQGESFFESGR
jgi:hypothetical protein